MPSKIKVIQKPAVVYVAKEEEKNEIKSNEKPKHKGPEHLTLFNLLFFIYMIFIKLGILTAVILIMTNIIPSTRENNWFDCKNEPCWWSNCPENEKLTCNADDSINLNCLVNACTDLSRTFLMNFYQPTIFHVYTARAHFILGYSLAIFLIFNFILGVSKFKRPTNKKSFIHSIVGYLIVGLWGLNLFIAYGHGSDIWVSRGYNGDHYNTREVDSAVAFNFSTYAHFLVSGLYLQDCLLNGIIVLQYHKGIAPPKYVSYGLIGTCGVTILLCLSMIFYLFWIAGHCSTLPVNEGHCSGDELIFAILHILEFICFVFTFYCTIIGHWMGSKFIVVPPCSFFVDSTQSHTKDDTQALHAICMYVVLGLTLHVGIANICNAIYPKANAISFIITVGILWIGFRIFSKRVLLFEGFSRISMYDLELSLDSEEEEAEAEKEEAEKEAENLVSK